MRRTTMRTRGRFDIPGWSVGYQDEISAHAAVRSPGKDLLFIMTSDDREPRSLDDEVTVGLYFFDGDEWQQIDSADFPSVSAVLDLNDVKLEMAVVHGMIIDDARQLLVNEIDDWVEGRESEEYKTPPRWAKRIFKDSGVSRGEDMETAAQEAIDQVLNASPAQVLEYMNARSDSITED